MLAAVFRGRPALFHAFAAFLDSLSLQVFYEVAPSIQQEHAHCCSAVMDFDPAATGTRHDTEADIQEPDDDDQLDSWSPYASPPMSPIRSLQNSPCQSPIIRSPCLSVSGESSSHSDDSSIYSHSLFDSSDERSQASLPSSPLSLVLESDDSMDCEDDLSSCDDALDPENDLSRCAEDVEEVVPPDLEVPLDSLELCIYDALRFFPTLIDFFSCSPRRIEGTTFLQSGAPAPRRLPSARASALRRLMEENGAVWADKTAELISVASSVKGCTLPLIVRPSGFGRTTFMHTLMDYYDAGNPRFADVAFEAMQCGFPGRNRGYRSQYLVMHLDLARTDSSSCEKFHESLVRLLHWETQSFIHKYIELLEWPSDRVARILEYPKSSFDVCLNAMMYSGCSMFLAIDNFTTPYKNAPDAETRDGINDHLYFYLGAVAEEFLGRGVIGDGIVVGEGVGCGSRGAFDGMTTDCTEAYAVGHAFGFTKTEVKQLGMIFSQGDSFVDDVERLVPSYLYGREFESLHPKYAYTRDGRKMRPPEPVFAMDAVWKLLEGRWEPIDVFDRKIFDI
ncbi:hypothetical protein FISHEDRAFT_68660 [Fistulina hepatica ATCC 64428]|uniref:AAA-ATPase-like domain-containing protein n=1 Tax=Fistulina hepatica ATCC 64428 TaxID=1128425 RepID=A0A0D7AP96_9AGAR|nr:hypothetical protein FISHEDRAFT_68660 [Fistulina hepatica ATCC 64428]